MRRGGRCASMCGVLMAAVVGALGHVQDASATDYLFSGRVYEGEVGVETQPIAGVTVRLYGSNSAYPAEGTLIHATTTDSQGWWGITLLTGEQTWEFYSLREVDPSGYESVGATSVDGTVQTANWIQYSIPLSGKTLTGNKFWDHRLATPTPTRTPTPTGIDFTFSGRVYDGQVGNEAHAIAGVTVSLYGANGAYPVPGTFIRSTTTDPAGWFGLVLHPAEQTWELYSVRETDPPGYSSVGATSPGGTVRSPNWIEFSIPLAGKDLTANKFWDLSLATPTATPTSTATLTASPTRTPTWTATLPPPPTSTFTPTATNPPGPTPTPTRTPTGPVIPTPTPTATPTLPGPPTATATPTLPGPPTPTTTPTRTPTLPPGITPTPTPTATTPVQPTPTPTWTPTTPPAGTPTPTPTRTPTLPPGVSLIEICATADTYVDQDKHGTNFGGGSELKVGFGQGINEPGADRILLAFDLSFIPASSEILNATLEMGQFFGDGLSPVPLPLYSVLDGWSEMSVTWDTQPPVSAAPAAGSQSVAASGVVVAWNVKELVQKWVNHQLANNGMSIRGVEGPPQWRRFFESRHYTTFCPRLRIEVRPAGPMSTPTPTATPTPTPTPTPVCGADEAGDTFSTAASLPSSLVTTGYICPSGDLDFWKFNLVKGEDVSIWLEDLPADYDLYLFSPGGGLYAASTRFSTANFEYLHFTASSSGDWRVMVFGKWPSEWSKSKTYTLTVRACNGEDEAGDGIDVAADLEVSLPAVPTSNPTTGYICPAGDEDWYQFEVTGGSTVTIEATLTNLPADYDLYLYNTYGYQRGISTNSGTTSESLTFTLSSISDSKEGLWFVRVVGATPTTFHPTKPYTLEVSLTGSADLTVQGIEVTQVVQDTSNSLTLVPGKPTVARVYVDTGSASSVSSVEVDLYGYKVVGGANCNWTALPGSPKRLGPQTVTNDSLADKRISYSSSFNYTLPSTWQNETTCTGGTRSVYFKAVVNPDQSIPESDFSDNDLIRGALFSSRKAVNVVFVPIKAAGLTPTLSGADYTAMLSYLKAIYPTATVNVSQWAGGALDADYDYAATPPEGQCGQAWDDLLNDLAAVRLFLLLTGMPSNGVVYGLLNPNIPHSSVSGCGRMGEGVSAGLLGINQSTLAHEVGHNLMLDHAPCGVDQQYTDLNWPDSTNPQAFIGEVGIRPDWTVPLIYKPYVAHDIMSYCDNRWLSPYHYSKVFAALGSAGTPAAPAPAPKAESGYLVAAGRFASATEVELRPLFVRSLPSGSSDDVGTGPYSLTVEDAGGASLSVRRFDPFAGCGPPEHACGPFSEVLPYPAGAARVVLRHEQETLRTVAVSAHAPTVHVVSPNGGESWNGTGPFQVEWTASDADGDPLVANVLYSRDGGTTWQIVAASRSGSPAQVDGSSLPGGDTSLVRVEVTDGVNTGSDTSDAVFHVQPKPPVVWLLSPAGDAPSATGDQVVLQGLATDPEDGPLDGDQLSWSSDRAGDLGTGSGVVTEALSCGDHAITLRATDSAHQTATASTSMTVCCITPLPETVHATASGGPAFVDVDATAAACEWQATSRSPWITIVGVTAGHGDGRVELSLAPNPSGAPRRGTVVVGTRTVTVLQRGQVDRARRHLGRM